MKTPFTQEVKKVYKVTFNVPEYNATYTFTRYPDSASFAYGNRTGVHLLIEFDSGKKDAKLFDTRYDNSVDDFDAWCEAYLSEAFDPQYAPNYSEVA